MRPTETSLAQIPDAKALAGPSVNLEDFATGDASGPVIRPMKGAEGVGSTDVERLDRTASRLSIGGTRGWIAC